jgi:hypothetical protein
MTIGEYAFVVVFKDQSTTPGPKGCSIALGNREKSSIRRTAKSSPLVCFDQRMPG